MKITQLSIQQSFHQEVLPVLHCIHDTVIINNGYTRDPEQK